MSQKLNCFSGLFLGVGCVLRSPPCSLDRPGGRLAMAVGLIGLPVLTICPCSQSLGSRERSLQRRCRQEWRRAWDAWTNRSNERQADASRTSNCWWWLAVLLQGPTLQNVFVITVLTKIYGYAYFGAWIELDSSISRQFCSVMFFVIDPIFSLEIR